MPSLESKCYYVSTLSPDQLPFSLILIVNLLTLALGNGVFPHVAPNQTDWKKIFV